MCARCAGRSGRATACWAPEGVACGGIGDGGTRAAGRRDIARQPGGRRRRTPDPRIAPLIAPLIAPGQLAALADGAPKLLLLEGVAVAGGPPSGVALWRATPTAAGLLLSPIPPPEADLPAPAAAPVALLVALPAAPLGVLAIVAPERAAAEPLLRWWPAPAPALLLGRALDGLAPALLGAALDRLASVTAEAGRLHRALAAVRAEAEATRSAHAALQRGAAATLWPAPPTLARTLPPDGDRRLVTTAGRLAAGQRLPLALSGIAGLELHLAEVALGPGAALRLRLWGADSGRVFGAWTVPGPALRPGWVAFDLPAALGARRETACLDLLVAGAPEDRLALSLGAAPGGADPGRDAASWAAPEDAPWAAPWAASGAAPGAGLEAGLAAAPGATREAALRSARGTDPSSAPWSAPGTDPQADLRADVGPDLGTDPWALRLWTTPALGRTALAAHWDEGAIDRALAPAAAAPGLALRLPAAIWTGLRALADPGGAPLALGWAAIGTETPRPALTLAAGDAALLVLPVVPLAGLDLLRARLAVPLGDAAALRAALWLLPRGAAVAGPAALDPALPGAAWSGEVAGDAAGGGLTLTLLRPIGRAGAAAAPDGPAPDGLAPDGTAPEGSAPEGPAPEGPAPEGPAPEGPAPEGPAPEGPAEGMVVLRLRHAGAGPLRVEWAELAGGRLRAPVPAGPPGPPPPEPPPSLAAVRLLEEYGAPDAGYRHLDLELERVRHGALRWPRLRCKLALAEGVARLEFRDRPDWPPMFHRWPGLARDQHGPLWQLDAAALAAGALGGLAAPDRRLLTALLRLLPAAAATAARDAAGAPAEQAGWVAAARALGAAAPAGPNADTRMAADTGMAADTRMAADTGPAAGMGMAGPIAGAAPERPAPPG